jgi:hypothetical protein
MKEISFMNFPQHGEVLYFYGQALLIVVIFKVFLLLTADDLYYRGTASHKINLRALLQPARTSSPKDFSPASKFTQTESQ